MNTSKSPNPAARFSLRYAAFLGLLACIGSYVYAQAANQSPAAFSNPQQKLTHTTVSGQLGPLITPPTTNGAIQERMERIKAADKAFLSRLNTPDNAVAMTKLRQSIALVRMEPEIKAKEAELRELFERRLQQKIAFDKEQVRILDLIQRHFATLRSINSNSLTPVYLF